MLSIDGVDGEIHYAPFDPNILPWEPGVYLVFQCDECLYVGKSTNMRRRWQTHHRMYDLVKISADLMMAWVLVPLSDLDRIETMLICQLQPRLNTRKDAFGPGKPIGLQLNDDLMSRIATCTEYMKISRPQAIRVLLHKGLDAFAAEEEPRA